MADTTGEQLACQYCGTDIRVPAERSRYEVSVAHFETAHVERRRSLSGADEQTEAVAGTTRPEPDRDEETGVSD